jgi:acyl carrier protein
METTLRVLESPLFVQLRDLTVGVLELPADQVVPEAHFADDLGADSLDLVELVEAIEAEFEIRIGDDELAEITTVGEAYEVVSGKLA